MYAQFTKYVGIIQDVKKQLWRLDLPQSGEHCFDEGLEKNNPVGAMF